MARRATKSAQPTGIRLGGGVTGKYLFRIRESHVADHLIPLMRKRTVGAAKLDLVLRCLGLLPQHTGERKPGFVLRSYSWNQLHDLARSANVLGKGSSDLDPSEEVVRSKRKWVGEQLSRLEGQALVHRTDRPGGRPELLVLRDDGSKAPLDDPTGADGQRYITLLGGVIASGHLASWGVPELSAYLAATVAERHAAASEGNAGPLGGGQWFRSLQWFADAERRYPLTTRTRMPFSTPTLERGFNKLEKAGLISRTRIMRDPRNNRRLQGPRILYSNHFDKLADSSPTVSPDELAREIKED